MRKERGDSPSRKQSLSLLSVLLKQVHFYCIIIILFFQYLFTFFFTFFILSKHAGMNKNPPVKPIVYL